MADWEDRDQRPAPAGDDWRGDRGWRSVPSHDPATQRPGEAQAPRAGDPRYEESRAFSADRNERTALRPRDEAPAGYSRADTPYKPGGGAARGYGEGGDTPYGQMASGSSVSGLGGYGGADVGGWGQPVQNSQWGQGGYGPLNQGLDYGQDGGRFGPRGYDAGNFGPTPPHRAPEHHDEHHVHYRRWRDTQLSSHDRDYARWREAQARRYDEDYGSWRNERHAAFSREFEGWRTGRGGQATGAPTSTADAPQTPGTDPTVNPSERSVSSTPLHPAKQGYAHGANPTLAKIADGHEGHHHHDHNKADDHGRDRDS